jgi:hypothetical protein
MKENVVETIHLIANQDARGGIVTTKGPRERHFATIDDLKSALERAAINPFKHKDQLAHLATGIPVALFVTSGQLSVFYS